MIPDSLRIAATEAFRDFEKVVVEHLLDLPGWRLDPEPLTTALDSGDPDTVRAFAERLRRKRAALMNATIIRTPRV